MAENENYFRFLSNRPIYVFCFHYFIVQEFLSQKSHLYPCFSKNVTLFLLPEHEICLSITFNILRIWSFTTQEEDFERNVAKHFFHFLTIIIILFSPRHFPCLSGNWNAFLTDPNNRMHTPCAFIFRNTKVSNLIAVWGRTPLWTIHDEKGSTKTFTKEMTQKVTLTFRFLGKNIFPKLLPIVTCCGKAWSIQKGTKECVCAQIKFQKLCKDLTGKKHRISYS